MAILPYIEKETGTHPQFSIIWLHGLGADGNDFVPLVPKFAQLPAIRFIFPHAPKRPITINSGMEMPGWYDIAGPALADKQDEPGIRESIKQVQALIEHENTRGIPAENILLAGFSQGGAIALATGLRHPEKLAGIIALSTYLPLQDKSADERHRANAGTPIFQAHGSQDPVVNPALGNQTCQWLTDHGYSVKKHTYTMAHQVCEEEIMELHRWLKAQLEA